jgi:hypothetical protein
MPLTLLGLLSACDTSRRAGGSSEVAQVDELTVQPMGGFLGAGGPGHVKSVGRIAVSALSQEDRAKVEALFSHPQPAPGNFYYRITRQRLGGTKSVDVPADAVPAALVASVKTVLE